MIRSFIVINARSLLFLIQNVYNFDYGCFYEHVKPSISKINNESYLGLYSVKFKKKCCTIIVFINIRSLNANIYKIEEFLSLVEGLPDVICVCKT